MKLSHSSISTYSDCPKRWEFKYVDRLPERPRHFFGFGKAIHSALEFMYSGDACPTLFDVFAAFSVAWTGEGYKDDKAEAKAKADGNKILTMFYNANAPGWRKPLSTEAKFDMEVDHVRVTGFIDRIDVEEDGGLHVLDYKTGRDLEAGRADTDEQLTMYQIAAEAAHPGTRVSKLSLYHVPSLTWHSSPRHGEDLVAALVVKVKSTADAVARKEFPATPSENACAFCDFKHLCPAWR